MDELKPRYGNLLKAGETLRWYGEWLKIAGIAIAGVGGIAFIVGFVGTSNWSEFKEYTLIFCGLLLAVSGGATHVSGVFIAAMGESAQALADIAMATAEQKKICPECGQWVMTSVRACGKCGFIFF